MPKLYSNDVQRLHLKFRRHEAKAWREFDTAKAFLDDGAYSSGARILREAAALFESSQAARNTALSLMVDEEVKT